MIVGNSIESFLGSSQFQLLNHAGLEENLKIAIHCAKADIRQSFPDQLIDLVGGWMRSVLPHLVHDYLPLFGEPQRFL
jgi:hypothetical protein